MFPKRAFITFSNEKYLPLITKLVESVLEFSVYPVIVYTYNFSHNFNNDRVYTKRIDNDLIGVPKYLYYNIHTDIGIVDRRNFEAYYTLSRKPTIITDAIENGLEEGIFLDADGIVRDTVDSMFDYLPECEDYPLVGRGLFEYMILNGKGGNQIPLELPLMKLLNVNDRTMHYVQTNFILFNKNCKSFFEECVSVSNNTELLSNFYEYAPWQDETIINVLLWKRGAKKHLPFLHFNLDNYNELLNFYENPKSDYRVRGCEWHYIPENKNDIKFFHGCKLPSELSKCIEYLKNKKYNMNSKCINKKRIAIVTLFDKNYKALADLSIPNKMAYAGKYNYDFIYFDDVIDKSRPPQWGMVKAVEKLLLTNKYDWVWWIDLDSLIMNFDIKLESIIDENYDIVFTANQYSYLSNGSAFYKNCDLTKQFLKDSYDLDKPYLKNIDVNVFDHAQQSMRLLLLNEESYRNRTKMIHERVCNSFCTTTNQSVLTYYPNWNIDENIYQPGDFLIQFCGRDAVSRVEDFFAYMAPKKIAIVTLAKEQIHLDKIKRSIKDTMFDYEYYTPNNISPHLYTSYSQMINESVENVDSEYIIFVSSKVKVTSDDITDIIKKLCSGYSFVSKVGFRLFGTTKQLFKRVGMMDERFLGGEFEDVDFALRLKMLNVAVYLEYNEDMIDTSVHTSQYNTLRGAGYTLFKNKWNSNQNNFVISSDDLSNKQLQNINNDYDLIKDSWYTFDKSYLNEDYFLAKLIKDANIQISYKKKKKVKVDLTLNIRYIDSELYISYECVTPDFISVHVYDLTDPNKHHCLTQYLLSSNMWWGNDLKKYNVLSELRIYHQGNILYRNILGSNFDIKLNLSTFTETF